MKLCIQKIIALWVRANEGHRRENIRKRKESRAPGHILL
jgi:hypothetical protein